MIGELEKIKSLNIEQINKKVNLAFIASKLFLEQGIDLELLKIDLLYYDFSTNLLLFKEDTKDVWKNYFGNTKYNDKNFIYNNWLNIEKHINKHNKTIFTTESIYKAILQLSRLNSLKENEKNNSLE